MTEGTGSAEKRRRRAGPAYRVAGRRLIRLGTVVLLAMGGVAAFAYPMNHDVAYCLHCGERMLRGEKLYVDIVDMNPPLVFYLSQGAAWLGRALGCPPTVVLNAAVLALAAASLGACGRALSRAAPEAPPQVREALLFVLAFVFVLATVNRYGKNNFGQREHLMFLLAAPYVLHAAARAGGAAPGRMAATAAGVMAGVALAFKPHFLALPAAVEGYLFLVRRRRAWLCPETVGIAAVLAAYGGFVALATPEYAGMIRLALRGYGGYLQFGPSVVFLNPTVRLCLAALAATALLAPASWNGELRGVLAAACVGLLASALLQNKGWDYHYYPAGGAAMMLLATVGFGPAERKELVAGLRGAMRWKVGLAPALVCVGVLAGGAKLYRAWAWPERGRIAELARVFERHARGRPVFVFSYAGIPVVYPALNYGGARWAGRFSELWAAGAPASRGRGGMDEAEKYMFDAVVADLLKEPPALLVLDENPNRPSEGGVPVDYVKYFSADVRFAELWRRYEAAGRVGDLQYFKPKED